MVIGSRPTSTSNKTPKLTLDFRNDLTVHVVAVDNAADAVAVVPVAVEKSLATDLRRLVGAVRTFGNSVAKDI